MTPADVPPRPADSDDKTWVFNPPPGWAKPPANWRPEEGWHPNPYWPAAPPGWEFWQPRPRRKRRGPGFYLKTGAAVVTFAATIVGVYVGIKGLPPSYTTADWVRQANATCDQDAGALNLSIFDGLLSPSAGAGGTSAQSTFDSKASAIVSASASVSKLVGDLSAQQTPKGGGASEVQTVLSSGNGLVDDMNTLSDELATVVDHTSSANVGEQVAADINNVENGLYRWQLSIKALHLSQCPFWSDNPKPTPAVSFTPGPSLTQDEQELVSEISPSGVTDCIGQPQLEVNGIVAAISCETTQAGPTQPLLIVQFADTGSAQIWFSDDTSSFLAGDSCADGAWLGPWNHDGTTAGMLGCSTTSNGGLQIVWDIQNGLIGAVAYGSDSPAMYEWWTNHALLTG